MYMFLDVRSRWNIVCLPFQFIFSQSRGGGNGGGGDDDDDDGVDDNNDDDDYDDNDDHEQKLKFKVEYYFDTVTDDVILALSI